MYVSFLDMLERKIVSGFGTGVTRETGVLLDWAGWGVGATNCWNWSGLFAAVDSWEIVWRSCESDMVLNDALKVEVEDMVDYVSQHGHADFGFFARTVGKCLVVGRGTWDWSGRMRPALVRLEHQRDTMQL